MVKFLQMMRDKNTFYQQIIWQATESVISKAESELTLPEQREYLSKYKNRIKNYVSTQLVQDDQNQTRQNP